MSELIEHDGPVIVLSDLDSLDPPARRRHPLTTRRFSVLALAAVLLAGIALGGVASYVWQAERARIADEAALELVLLPDQSTPSDVSGDASLVQFRQRLTVMNLGPLPVEVTDVRGQEGGIEVLGLSESRVINPGVSQLELNLRVSCVPSTLNQPVTVEMTVRNRSDGTTGRRLTRVISLYSPQSAEWTELSCGRGPRTVTLVNVFR